MTNALPPEHNINPDTLDDELNPTTAWTVGEMLDPDTVEALRKIREA